MGNSLMAWLDDNPPARSQFRRPRREAPSGVIVVHTAENTPDTVATDGGAEAVANFIRNRTDPGSYHDLCDSDSAINLVGYDAEAFHDATGSNPHSYGVSAATRADLWPIVPGEWRDGCVRQMAAAAARYARWLKARTGIVIPARRISRSQSDARQPGFISHAERDPARRTDPGARFPWDQFLAQFAQFTDQEDDMPLNETDKVIISNLIRQELYGDDKAHSKGVTPIIRNEVRAVLMELWPGGFTEAFGEAMQAAVGKTQGRDGEAAAQVRARANEGALEALETAGLYVPPDE